LINVTGSLVLGFLAAWLPGRFGSAEHAVRLALPVGFVGAYTTFSTYELELLHLGQQRAWWLAALYALGSVILGFGAVQVGGWLGRRI
ncbi:MAG: CrcB family protein, partial [Armatimonadetes bacterium]|nr:CrcB family protein [Armatimonadota bacterium]